RIELEAEDDLPTDTPLNYMGPVLDGPEGTTGPWFSFILGNTNPKAYIASIGDQEWGAHNGTSWQHGTAYGGSGPSSTTSRIPRGGAAGSFDFILADGDGLYTISHAARDAGQANVWAKIDTTPNGRTIGVYGLRFVAADGTDDSRMYYSDAFPGWATWGSSSYYDEIGRA